MEIRGVRGVKGCKETIKVRGVRLRLVPALRGALQVMKTMRTS